MLVATMLFTANPANAISAHAERIVLIHHASQRLPFIGYREVKHVYETVITFLHGSLLSR